MLTYLLFYIFVDLTVEPRFLKDGWRSQKTDTGHEVDIFTRRLIRVYTNIKIYSYRDTYTVLQAMG